MIPQSPATDLGLLTVFFFFFFAQVLCVGNLYNPDVRYSFNIPIEEHKEQFVWDPSGSWLECSRICHGKNSAWQPSLCKEHGGIFKGFFFPPWDVVRNRTWSPTSLLIHIRILTEKKKVSGHIRVSIYLTSLTHIFGLNNIPSNSLVINPLPVNLDLIPVNHI